MTITNNTTRDLFQVTTSNGLQLIRLSQRFSPQSQNSRRASTTGWWTHEEHEKFLEAMEKYPSGPWKKIARHVGSRTSRQVMTHAQKYRQRIKRLANRSTRGRRNLARQSEVKAATKAAASDVVNVAPEVANTLIDPLLLEELCAVTDSVDAEIPLEWVSPVDKLPLGDIVQPNHYTGVNTFLNDDEIVAFLSDPTIDWIA
ncbi:hypothetical protein PHYBOEH_009979 [Phytophthora boehmeriae]|uniref:Myb-like DNA-binding protein n=1 Tax=Phytophthora boehmeriae TaxID=109152 RepID=A0A8T1WZV5_9STRA|nr:hypothetical protein PHYBOEH_009979 [Phytophthora boehmeriae]